MFVIQDFAAYRHLGLARPTAVTIGNFDGCHRGHQGLLASAVAHAERLGGPAVAVTFAPRPDAFLKGKVRETLLFTEDQKTRALAESGIQVEVLKAFDAAFSRVPHAEFYERALRGQLGAKAVIIGDNFRFGFERGGDTAYLASRGTEDGITVEIGTAATYGDERISSTRIRSALARGEIAEVTDMLGRPYLLEGIIASGDRLGRQLGVPTANLEQVDQLLPRFGIYAGYVWLGDAASDLPSILQVAPAAIPAVYSIGVRPTLDNQATGPTGQPPVRLEAHLLAGSYGADELYGRRAGFYFTHRLRDELAFADLESLKRQMAVDIATAKSLVIRARS